MTPLDAIQSSIAMLRTGPALAVADLFVTHPDTWSALLKIHDNYGRYVLTPNGPILSPSTSLWDVPVLQTTQIAAGTGLLLDTSKFGRVFMREGLSLKTGYANDDLVRNLVRFVAEERLVLAVERPAAVLELTGLPVA